MKIPTAAAVPTYEELRVARATQMELDSKAARAAAAVPAAIARAEKARAAAEVAREELRAIVAARTAAGRLYT